MALKKKNSLLGGLLVGPAIIGLSATVLWKNEHRFDYYKAAKQSVAVSEVGLSDLPESQVFSYTGSMDLSLTMEGNYVREFQGYLKIWRNAEIFAWKREEDDDGVSWSRQWMTGLQGNERNRDLGLEQTLHSKQFFPKSYAVDDLEILSEDIQFVDSKEGVPISSLTLTRRGQRSGLVAQEKYFYLDKKGEDKLGDERVSYRGITVPETASYFGAWENERAVAKVYVQTEGISKVIGDHGLLHHLVAGDREAGLARMKAHLQRTKMIVRAVGCLLQVIGWLFFFSTFMRFLFHVPVIGVLANYAVFWVSLIFGLVIGALIIVVAYTAKHPILLVGVGGVAAAVVGWLIWNARRSQAHARRQLSKEIGHTPSADEIKELEFKELVHLSNGQSGLDAQEKQFLQRWGQRQGWGLSTTEKLIAHNEASEGVDSESPGDHLRRLITLALADGQMDREELSTLKYAAKQSRISSGELKRMIADARRSA
ncbi:MAG: TMEM43 family protein [Verrucomicrobiota bacterium]